MRSDEKKIAIEETCHAIIANVYGKPVISVSVETRSAVIGNVIDWTNPEVELPFGDDEETKPSRESKRRAFRIRRSMRGFLAGECGNFIAYGDPKISNRLTEEEIDKYSNAYVSLEDLRALPSDMARAIVLAKQLDGDVDVRAEIECGERKVERILRGLWKRVLRVSDAVLAQRTIDEAEFKRLVALNTDAGEAS